MVDLASVVQKRSRGEEAWELRGSNSDPFLQSFLKELQANPEVGKECCDCFRDILTCYERKLGELKDTCPMYEVNDMRERVMDTSGDFFHVLLTNVPSCSSNYLMTPKGESAPEEGAMVVVLAGQERGYDAKTKEHG